MPANIDYQDAVHTGQHTFQVAPIVPNSSFGDDQMKATDPLSCTKTDHQYTPRIAQAHGSAAADERRVVHVAKAAGEVTSFQAGPIVAAIGGATVTADLVKNGTTVLSAPISIDNGDAAFAKVSGAISSAAYVAGDVFEVILDATVGGGTLPQGIWAQPTFREAAG